MNSDNARALVEFAEDLRDARGELSAQSLLCQRAAQELFTLRSRVTSLEAQLSKGGELHQWKRMATALEQAAMYGWGKVCSNHLEE